MEATELANNARTALERLRGDETTLTREIDVLQARLEMTREMIDMLAGKATRRRRARVQPEAPAEAAPEPEAELAA